jgi:hypothetical protein
MFGSVARRHPDEAAPLRAEAIAASSKARAGARQEIKDFHGALLSSWSPLGHLETKKQPRCGL